MRGSVAKLQVLATSLGKAEKRAKDLRRQRDEMITELFASGTYTSDDIAEYAGMSQARVVQISRKETAHRERHPAP